MTPRRRATTILVSLGLAASASPALALPTNLNANGSEVPATALSIHSQPTQTTSPPTIVRVSSPNGGFDWGDAGIGAAGGIALSMIGMGSALAVSARRARRPTAHHA